MCPLLHMIRCRKYPVQSDVICLTSYYCFPFCCCFYCTCSVETILSAICCQRWLRKSVANRLLSHCCFPFYSTWFLCMLHMIHHQWQWYLIWSVHNPLPTMHCTVHVWSVRDNASYDLYIISYATHLIHYQWYLVQSEAICFSSYCCFPHFYLNLFCFTLS